MADRRNDGCLMPGGAGANCRSLMNKLRTLDFAIIETGLYLDAFLRGSEFAETQVDNSLREELREFAEREGNEALHAELQRIDPESAAQIHPNNVKRVIRAIEIYRTGGKTKSELDRLSKECEGEYDALVISLRYNNRALLYDRIDCRVDEMIAQGLVEETRALLAEGIFDKNSTASQAIGYKEMFGKWQTTFPCSAF